MRIGVIGVGSMGKNHARVLNELGYLTCVSDYNPSSKYTVPQYRDYREMLDEVDAVVIATPTDTHYEIAKDCIEKGIHVLIEKPITIHPKDGEELIKLAKNNNVVLAVGHIERHNPAVKYIKEQLKSNKFGKIYTLSSRRLGMYPHRIKDVGVILDLSILEIDMMRYIVDSEIESIYSKHDSYKGKEEDSAVIILKFKNGITGVIEVNWLTPIKIRNLNISCESHFIELDYINQTINISKSLEYPLISDTTNISMNKIEPLKREIEDFIQSIDNSTEPTVTGRDGVEALKIARKALYD